MTCDCELVNTHARARALTPARAQTSAHAHTHAHAHGHAHTCAARRTRQDRRDDAGSTRSTPPVAAHRLWRCPGRWQAGRRRRAHSEPCSPTCLLCLRGTKESCRSVLHSALHGASHRALHRALSHRIAPAMSEDDSSFRLKWKVALPSAIHAAAWTCTASYRASSRHSSASKRGLGSNKNAAASGWALRYAAAHAPLFDPTSKSSRLRAVEHCGRQWPRTLVRLAIAAVVIDVRSAYAAAARAASLRRGGRYHTEQDWAVNYRLLGDVLEYSFYKQ